MTDDVRAIVTLCSSGRLDHVRRQIAAVRRLGDERIRMVMVWVGDDEPPALDVHETVHVPPGPDGLRLAAARNAGAERAIALGAEAIIFLDADCVPGPDLVERYVSAARNYGNAVLCGPVTYLEAGVDVDNPTVLASLTRPHPARPAPPAGTVELAAAHEYPLFWSLSFAMTAERWSSIALFDDRFEGYGGEDTDFAFELRRAGVPLAWVGGAHAYHQHHPTSSPPWQHLDDILRNGGLFAEKWGEWPMTGWLEAFERDGAIERTPAGWRRV